MLNHKNQCVILAAGPVTDYEAAGRRMPPGAFVICADGGTKHLKPLNATPDIVMGDFDSAGDSVPEGVETIGFKAEKDETDTQLAVQYGLEKGYRDFLIIGALGGRLDHTYANFCTLLFLANAGASGVLFDSACEVRLLLQGELRLKKREGFYVSVFPLGLEASGVCEKGMKYALDDACLTADFPLGVSNEFKGPEALISVQKGPLLIILSKK